MFSPIGIAVLLIGTACGALIVLWRFWARNIKSARSPRSLIFFCPVLLVSLFPAGLILQGSSRPGRFLAWGGVAITRIQSKTSPCSSGRTCRSSMPSSWCCSWPRFTCFYCGMSEANGEADQPSVEVTCSRLWTDTGSWLERGFTVNWSMALLYDQPSRTFGEFLLIPNQTRKETIPARVDLKVPIVRYPKGSPPPLSINVPITAAMMRSVSDDKLAIALARCGGWPFLYGSQSIASQAERWFIA